jgi:hypothetical protein
MLAALSLTAVCNSCELELSGATPVGKIPGA